MPRPGPRPYECVRRAWHSDRHKPIRGSLIQEIFRVVNEIHSSATKKNKEWQEKLPVVVLKAEEIMYSKANSEAEYMDLKTLWDRANDAINTIIRRDETTETGELLQPCIEAALNLGCTPRRASRSQRNNNVRCYLSPYTQEPTSNPPSILENSQGNQTTNSQYMSHYSNLVKPRTMDSIHLPVAQNNIYASNKFPFSSENFLPSGNNQCLPMENYPPSRLYSVYPLYYGNHFQCDESQFGFGIPPKSNTNATEPAEMGIIQNLFSCNLDASNKITQTDFSDIPENAPEVECDLSLRLGPHLVPCISVENSWHQEVEDVGSSSSREGSKFCDPLPQMDKGFLPKNKADDPLDSCSSKWDFEDKNLNVQATMRKRKALVGHPTEDRQFCWQPKLPYNHFTGRMRNADKEEDMQGGCQAQHVTLLDSVKILAYNVPKEMKSFSGKAFSAQLSMAKRERKF